MKETAEKVLSYIENSPTAFHAVNTLKCELDEKDFIELDECESWSLTPGGKYYVKRNDTSIASFVLPKNGKLKGFRIIAGHSDSPCFKIKVNPEIKAAGGCVKLNVEKYGGMIDLTWFDRPLSIAGRVIVDEGGELNTKLFNIRKDLLMIPSLAIHMERSVNQGKAFNVQNEMLPVLMQWQEDSENEAETLRNIIASEAKVDAEKILGGDAFLYNRMPGSFWGANEEFISSARLDDLECVYSTFMGFIDSEDTACEDFGRVHVVFDNEEVGSLTAQGADSTFLSEVLERISLSLGYGREAFMAQAASSFMLSADNAHAVHPNRSEKADPVNRPVMNGGVVLKYNADQKYTTDGLSSAIVVKLCEDNGIPYQRFTNRSDMAGGSTLGNISQAHISMKTADIGLAQLAMHSSYESAGADDPEYMRRLASAFYKG